MDDMVGMYKETQHKKHQEKKEKKGKKSKSSETHQELASSLKSKYSGLITSFIGKNGTTSQKEDLRAFKLAEYLNEAVKNASVPEAKNSTNATVEEKQPEFITPSFMLAKPEPITDS